MKIKSVVCNIQQDTKMLSLWKQDICSTKRFSSRNVGDILSKKTNNSAPQKKEKKKEFDQEFSSNIFQTTPRMDTCQTFSGKRPAVTLTVRWVTASPWWAWPCWSSLIRSVQREELFVVNMADKISRPLPLCRTRYAFQTRPGTYLEAGILSEAYLPPFHVNPQWQIGQEFLWSPSCNKVETFSPPDALKTIIFATMVTEM